MKDVVEVRRVTQSDAGGESGVTRRDALRYGGVGIASLMTPALLAACGSEGSTSGGGVTGTVISGQAYVPITFDPHTASELGALTSIAYAFEGLYGKGIKPPYRIEPQLAGGDPEELSPTRYRVALRSGALFHDGAPVTARDVKATFDRMIDPATGALLAGYMSIFKSIEADGDGAVVINLNFPTTLLKDRLALVRIIPASMARNKGSAKVFNLKPVGSGPYAFTSISPDLTTVRLERFDKYNGPLKVSLDSIEVQSIASDEARVSALRTDRIAAITDPPFNALDQLADTPGLDAAGKLAFQQSILIFNNSKKPFDDKRVRQAIFHAVDREAITDAVFFGYAEAATSYLPSSNRDYKRPTTLLEYDPDRARQLLAEAGASNLSFELLLSNLGWLAPQAPLLESQWRDVGIDVRIRQGEVESLAQEVTKGEFDAFLTVTDPSAFGNDDGQFLIQWIYGEPVASTFLYWTGPAQERMASLLEEALKSTSKADLRRRVGEMQDLIAEEVPGFPLHHRDTTGAWSERLSLELNPVFGIDLREARSAA